MSTTIIGENKHHVRKCIEAFTERDLATFLDLHTVSSTDLGSREIEADISRQLAAGRDAMAAVAEYDQDAVARAVSRFSMSGGTAWAEESCVKGPFERTCPDPCAPRLNYPNQ